MEIEIEDLHEDLIGKVMRARGISKSQLAELSGVSKGTIGSLLDGGFDEAAVRAVAPPLDLDAESLVTSGKKTWRPEPIELPGLAQFNTEWHGMRVNSYLAWDPQSKKACAFDSGADASGMLSFAREHELSIEAIHITHTHGDHIADLEALAAGTGNPPIFVSQLEPLDGATLIDTSHRTAIGALELETRHTHGHSVGGLSFVVSGLARPVAIVGDALFAGSMGGAKVSLDDALRTNREQLFTLPDDTIVCPGHGPMTSIIEEKQHNPFFPEFKTQ